MTTQAAKGGCWLPRPASFTRRAPATNEIGQRAALYYLAGDLLSEHLTIDVRTW
ncbi:hypothetical protein ABZU45_37065 [Streptomyces avermitilis]|uniref:hypothetical protein n=1 Tax=Streptomyces avermitilis TaxID=33903 RepID=UPI0033B0D07B